MRTPSLGSTRTLSPTTSMSSTVRWLRVHDVEVGHREHAEDGRLYAILKDDDCTREEPVDLFPFAELVTATRPYSESEADFLL